MKDSPFYAYHVGLTDDSWAVLTGFVFVATNLTRYEASRKARDLNAARNGRKFLEDQKALADDDYTAPGTEHWWE